MNLPSTTLMGISDLDLLCLTAASLFPDLEIRVSDFFILPG